MKSVKIRIIIICSILLYGIFSSCKKEQELNYDFFLIKVDSIQIPENIVANESFDIIFYGTIGTNGCKQFSEFRTEKSNNEIIVEAWGKFDKKSNICPEVMVYLDGEKLNYLIKEKGNYTFRIKQTDDNSFDQQISVK